MYIFPKHKIKVMRIAILGATSAIAQDLILSFLKKESYEFHLYGRNVELLEKWVNNANLKGKYHAQGYSSFDNNQKYNVIINCVGIGDPAKVQKMSSDILKVTEQYDDMALDYIKLHKKTKYIFLSSGAVFGGSYRHPVDENTVASVDINNLGSTDWYAISKLYAEVKHRSLPDLSIVDVRIFNYFSLRQDMNSNFFMQDLLKAAISNKVFNTSSENISRDYITPQDFYSLIQAIIDYKPLNTAIDSYTKSHMTKFDLLSELESKFGLKYNVMDELDIPIGGSFKMNYYSTNKFAEVIGYSPKYDSLEGVLKELSYILANKR